MIEEITLQEKLLEKNAIIFVHKLPILTRLHGLRCDIYLPQTYQGNYDNDGKRVYGLVPDSKDKFIVFNYFQLGQFGDSVFDPFSDAVKYIVTDKNKRLVLNSKIVVWQGLSYYEYRVDNFKSYRGKDGYILTQNILIPLV
jgi:hypothetical protein